MAKFFLILTILVSGVAAYFGYTTNQKVDTVKNTLTQVRKDRDDTKVSLKQANEKVADTQKKLDDTSSQLSAKTEEANNNKKAADAAEAAKAEVQTALDKANTDLAEAQKQIATLSGATKPGDVTDGGGIAAKLKEAQAQLAESQQLAQTLQSKVKEAEDRAAELQKKEAQRQAVLARPGLEGQVMAVNSGYGFAVISIGDRQGAVANAQLIVKRGDTMVGKLKISSVEPSTSIADIVPDSLGKGQRIQPGDRVIFQGNAQ